MGVFPPVPPRRLLGIGILSCFGTTFHFGYQLMLLNPTKPVLDGFIRASFRQNYGFVISDRDYATLWSVILNSLVLGAATSLLLLPLIANHIGRKKGLYLSQCVFVIATIPAYLSYTFKSLELFLFSRFLYGTCCGVASGLTSLYLNEIAAKKSRGFLSALTGLFVETGLFVASVLGLPSVLGSASLWPFLFVAELLPTLLLLCALPFFPESPKFLLANGRSAEARRVLEYFEKDGIIVEETLNEAEVELKIQSQAPSIGEFLKNHKIRAGLIAGVLVCVLIPLNGILAIDFFTTTLMTDSGFSSEQATTFNLFITFCSILAGIIGTITIDKFGRRPLLLIGNFTMLTVNCVFFVVFRVSEYYKELDEEFTAAAYIFLVGSCVFMFTFAMGPGPIQWFITAEMVPVQFKAHASSLSLLFIYILDLVSGMSFLPLYTSVGSYAFLMFIIPLGIITTLLCFLLPETKNRSVPVIMEELNDRGLGCCGVSKTEETVPILVYDAAAVYGTKNI